MLLNTKELNKFNLQVGGKINISDAFYLMNSEAGQNYYFNVDSKKTISQDGQNKILELSASLFPTKFRFKLFLDAFSHFDAIIDSYKDKTGKEKISQRQSNPQDDVIIFSGDTIRLMHQESGVFLMSAQKNLGDRSLMPSYPEFLNQQIRVLAETAERYTEDEADA